MNNPHAIVKTEVTGDNIRVTLANGVTFDVSSNKGYLHLHFSGTKDHIVATPCHNYPDIAIPKMNLSNYLDLAYTPSRED